MARKVMMADAGVGEGRGRPRLSWMEGVKMSLGSREMTVEAARQCAKDGMECRALVQCR